MTKFERNVREAFPDQSDRILGLIRGTLDPDTFGSVQRWTTQCYNEPSRHEKIACALNEVIEGYGVEVIDPSFSDGNYGRDTVDEYINLGDTYDTTLLYIGGRWSVGSWGDIVESRS